MSVPLQKPPHGSPCNKCGLCCEDQLCPLGSFLFERRHGPCPALQHNQDGTGTCGLVMEPRRWAPLSAAALGEERLSRAAQVLIGADSGCDALLKGEPVNEAFRAELCRRARRSRHAANLALDTWGVA